jgi:ornithine cyclodeaminase
MPGLDHDGSAIENTLLLMPAWTGPGSENYVGVKLVAVYPGNGQVGLPSIHGLYYLIDGNTGVPLATMDGARMTVWRTAAASALASTYLSRPESSTLTMIGAGALSPFMIRAHMAVRPIQEVFLWNHNIRRAHELAEQLRSEGLPVISHPDLVTAVGKSDIVSAATLTTTPLIFGKWLKPGTHVDTVGAFTPTMRETDDELVRSASIFCDTRTGALKEGGDLAIPISQGVISPDDVVADLHDLTRRIHAGRTSNEEITYFKSVGTALEDLAGAITVWQSR